MHDVIASAARARTRRTLATVVATLCCLHASASSALACPDCTIGRAARRDVWSDDFATNLAFALAPFAVMVAVSAWADRIGRPTNPKRGPHG